MYQSEIEDLTDKLLGQSTYYFSMLPHSIHIENINYNDINRSVMAFFIAGARFFTLRKDMINRSEAKIILTYKQKKNFLKDLTKHGLLPFNYKLERIN